MTEERGDLIGFLIPEWYADALCAQVGGGADIWFPEKGGSTREAKAICAKCTVQAECIDYALANQERFGLWGGLSERERRKIAKRLDTTTTTTTTTRRTA